MPYVGGQNQDDYCKDRCKCRCGYYLAREQDNWSIPDFEGQHHIQPKGSNVEYYAHAYKKDSHKRQYGDVIISGPKS